LKTEMLLFKQDNADGTLSAVYTPKVDGNHVITVQLDKQDIGGAGSKKSPFKVCLLFCLF
jgi:hypothetical protein